jgi:hypothetical protein
MEREDTMAHRAKDYLAVISNGIAGSFARGADREKAIKDVARIYRNDFRDFYKFKKGVKVVINVVDVTGHDDIWWNESGFFVGDQKLDRTIERVEHVY